MSILSAAYSRAARARRAWYERRPHARRRLGIPVISVGNLTVGGSGKTPCVMALARLLRDAGRRPAILSRGYARAQGVDGVVVVSDGQHVLATVDQSGDEPQMMARALPGVPVLVSADRYLAGCVAARGLGADVALLDDGFQHVQLERDIDLLLVDPADLDQAVLPSGPLREPLAAARAADAALVGGTTADAERVSRALAVSPAFTLRRYYASPRSVNGAVAEPLIGRAIAVAGIARPRSFFDAAGDAGFEIAEQLAFRDHHRYTRRDVERIRDAAARWNARIILTTEKDAMRLEAHTADLGGAQWLYLPMELAIEPAAVFASWLKARL